MLARALVFASLMLWGFHVYAGGTCPDAQVAEAAVDNLNSWQDVYRFYRRYRDCFDGAVAEGASDRIEQMWIKHWDTLPKMIALTSKDRGFHDFIWARIDEEIFPQESFSVLVANAQQRCPKSALRFCAAVIASSVRTGLTNGSSDRGVVASLSQGGSR